MNFIKKKGTDINYYNENKQKLENSSYQQIECYEYSIKEKMYEINTYAVENGQSFSQLLAENICRKEAARIRKKEVHTD